MPTTVKKSSKSAVAKKTVTAKPKKIALHANDVHEPVMVMGHACQSCNALPTGSIELVSLLLVLVFALSAVLMTSVYALHLQASKTDALQYQIDMTQAQVE
ncbi:hypothetical protein KJ673_01735 [Patescibacteria group bacterium]|nr:hypothetical protein [Patescibacteria group bacterium]MBU4453240.1 hypothetical protein [Patescibacteria group bacterium]MCG2687200.1 hypothetical protein [Candidatus Parcubacteria bacterium]